MQPRIGLAMIVQNEQANLAQCLESVKDHVQEVVIVDTGSIDKTIEIARQYTDKVFSYPWNNDFSAARNFGVSQLTSSWALVMDADEVLQASTCSLANLLDQYPETEAFYLPIYQTAPGIETADVFPALRLFRRDPAYQFQGLVHEELQLPPSLKCLIVMAPIIRHRIPSEQARQAKSERNLSLLQQMDPEISETGQSHFFMGLELYNLNRFEEALPHLQKALSLTEPDGWFRTAAIRYTIRCLNTLNRDAEAIGVCIRETKRHPDYCDLHYEGGVIFKQKQEYELAIKWFKKAMACGTPPAGYYHTIGTEGFLSWYHLACCFEIEKQFSEAEHYYQQAITGNSHFFKALEKLFLMKSASSGPTNALNYLLESELIQTKEQALFLGELLSNIGFYRLASNCLQKITPKLQAANDVLVLKHIVRYENFSGNPAAALDTLNHLRTSGQTFDTEMAAEEITALLLLKDYPTAAEKANALLCQDQMPEAALAFLNMTTLATQNKLYGVPEKNGEPAVIERILGIIDRCLSYIPDNSEKNNSAILQLFTDLTSLGIRTLTYLSPESAVTLINYFQEKTNTVQKLMNFKFHVPNIL